MTEQVFTPPFNEYVRQRIAAVMARQEKELRRLLGLWVSELEPEMVFQSDGHGLDRFIGLTFAGIPVGCRAPIILHARS